MIIKIVNVVDHSQRGTFGGAPRIGVDGAIYVGRANRYNGLKGSVLANPYRIGPDGSRARTIEQYREWLARHVSYGSPEIIAELARLASIMEREKRLTLACWCAPLPCHADVIAEHLKAIFSAEDV